MYFWRILTHLPNLLFRRFKKSSYCCHLMAKQCTLSSDKPPLGCLYRESVVRIIHRLDMTSHVYSGRKASTKTNIYLLDIE